jgi:alpha-mannosidase
MTFGLLPHAGAWADGGVVEAAERYRHDLVSAHGSAATDAWSPGGAGDDALTVEGANVTLSSLRRRDDWLEARLVNLAGEPVEAVLTGGLTQAREVNVLDAHGPRQSV